MVKTIDAAKLIAKLNLGELDEGIRQKRNELEILEVAKKFRAQIEQLTGDLGGEHARAAAGNARGMLPKRVHAWLKEHGPAMPKAIAEAVGSTSPSVGTVMRKTPKRFRRGKTGWEAK